MKDMPPRVSVIIPAYNRARLVVESLESVLNQTYRDFEIIVIDDGSTDNTPEVLQPFLSHIIYRRQENQGQPSATNLGISLARGEYIALLDSDDVWVPDKLEKQVAFLDRHPEYAMVTGNGVYKDNERKRLVSEKRARRLQRHDMTLRDLFMKSTIRTPTILFRRGIIESVGMLDPSLKSSIHLDFAFRVLLKHRIAFMNDILIRVGRHEGERISSAEERRQLYNLKVIRKLLDSHPEALEIIGEKNVTARIAYRYYRLAKLSLKNNEYTKAIEYFRLANQYRPASAKYFFYRLRADIEELLRNPSDPEAEGRIEVFKDGFELRVRKRSLRPALFKELEREITSNFSVYDSASRHAKNRKVEISSDGRESALFFKRFSSPYISYSIKDIFRPSKAVKAWNAAVMLSKYGFHSAPVALAGEKRKFRLLTDAILITEEVPADSFTEHASKHFQQFNGRDGLRNKRKIIRLLAREVGRMHRLGIVHGDLLPGNILVDESNGEVKLVFLDNDRTRRTFRKLPGTLVVRNLVQLGRFPMPGVTLTDRLRFFETYVEENPRFRGRERRLLSRIVRITRERVLKIERSGDKLAETLSFRALMSGK